MTVYMYTGTPGSGKSLDTASVLRWQLNHKRPVIGNFRIHPEVVKHPELYTYLPNERLTADNILTACDEYWATHPDVPFREDWVTLIVDECQLCFNSREWQKSDRMSFVSLLSQSRKAGLKVILVAQGDKMVDNQFRMLVEYEVKHRKISTAGLTGWLMALPFRGLLFVKVLYYYQMKEKLSSEWFIARKKDMQVYDTTARFDRPDVRTLALAADPSA